MDWRLYAEEVEVSTAWAEALVAAGAISGEEGSEIAAGLARVGERIGAGAALDAEDEDVHTLVERLLSEEIGELAGALRTGRSRNDQVATIARLWLMRALERLDVDLAAVQEALLSQAERSVDIIGPSYTHLQRAQPVRMAHFFLSHFWPLARDRDRLMDLAGRVAVLPLGAGAIAGSGYPIDRERLRVRLGFRALAANSMDAVSDRDFVAEFAAVGALTGAHVSRLAEDLILFSSSEFGFVRFSDTYSTGSSLMPQKRNPDIAEIARGKSAVLLSRVTGALALLKSLPSGYNKDLQEDKPILFEVYDTLHRTLPPLAGAIAALEIDGAAIRRALDPSMLAVDVADALVRRGLRFSQAHSVAGRLVRAAEEKGVSILDVEASAAAEIHPLLPEALAELAEAEDPYERSVEARTVSGGVSRSAVLEQLEAARNAIAG